MSYLFTVVSAEQQEIVAGGNGGRRRNISLDVTNKSYEKVTFAFKQNAGHGQSTTQIDYSKILTAFARTQLEAPASVLL